MYQVDAINKISDNSGLYNYENRVYSKQLYRGFRACIVASNGNNMSVNEVFDTTNWDMKVANQNNLEDNFLVDSLNSVDDNDDIDCKADSIIKDALEFWGIPQVSNGGIGWDFLRLVCGTDMNSTEGGIFKLKYDRFGPSNRLATCNEMFEFQNYDKYWFETKGSAGGDALKDFLNNTVYKDSGLDVSDDLTDEEYYAMYLMMANSSHCRNGNAAPFVASSSTTTKPEGYEKIQMITYDEVSQKYVTKEYLYYSDKIIDFAYLTGNGYNVSKIDCNNIYTKIGDANSKYVKAALDNANKILEKTIDRINHTRGCLYPSVFVGYRAELAKPPYGDRINKNDVVAYPNISNITFICENAESGETEEVETGEGVETGGVGLGVANPNANGGNEASESTCDIGALGWIICPIVNTLDSLLGKIYEWIEHSLMVPASFLATDNGTFKAWEVFRNFANIAFIILLMVVIFSQVTSLGISNYGIKKILPRIIVVGILINLSYFICQIAVDLSNILGAGLNDLLRSIEIPGTNPGTFDGSNGILNGIGMVLGIGTLGAISVMLVGGWAVLFAVIGFLLSALVSLLMMFVALAFRQIGVIVLIAAAPLAIVCKLLPNTEKIFSSWTKMLKTLLVLYPICGALVGGGVLVGRIVAASADPIIGAFASAANFITFGAVGSDTKSDAGMIVQVLAALCTILPYFGVFTLTKKSLEGLGQIGGAITSKLNGAQGKLNGALDKSPIGKNGRFAQYQKQQHDIKRGIARGKSWEKDDYSGKNPFRKARAGIRNAKAGIAGSKFGKVTGIGGYAAQQARGGKAALNKQDQEAVSEHASNFAKMGTGEEVKAELDQALASGDANRMEAAINELANRGDYNHITDSLKNLDDGQITAMKKNNPEMFNRLTNSLVTKKKDAAHLWAWSLDAKTATGAA
jgi:hypothetical protein